MERVRLIVAAIVGSTLVVACSFGSGESAPFCDVVDELRNLAPSGEMRITAEFVPNTPHGAFLTDPACRSSIVRVAFPDRSRLKAFFDEAYSGGGITTRIWVDATIRAEPATVGEAQGLNLVIDSVHGFRDVSVIRPPRPGEHTDAPLDVDRSPDGTDSMTLEIGGVTVECGDAPIRRTLHLRSSGRHTALTERFAGGAPIGLALPGQAEEAGMDRSVQVVIDFLRDREKFNYFNLELDADFEVVCSHGEILLKPVRVHTSRLRRYRRE